MIPIYLQRWSVEATNRIRLVCGKGIVFHSDAIAPFVPTEAHEKAATLAAAAPAMACELVVLEWSEVAVDTDDGTTISDPQCPRCGSLQPGVEPRYTGATFGHDASCSLDALLTKIGFSDQASRDEARRTLEATKGGQSIDT